MHARTRSETGDMASVRSSRAPSFSSDRPSVASSVTFQMPSTVRPPPAYIAASVASQMVTDHHNAQLHEQDAAHEELPNAVFSGQALALLNAFLDHLLFAFLSSARSPSLTAIRPAIADVLKPRLAREATEAADEELQGLLADEDDAEFPAQHTRAGDMDRWDVEKVWKRTRLRIMVYTRLGELEDDDEDRYVQQERGLSMEADDDDEAGLVSWASAIFLTSVVEYVAEQTLLVAGAAAYARMAAKQTKRAQRVDGADEHSFGRLVVEEPDVEKIALNSALGRLWRTWRKRVRSPISPTSPGRGIRPVSSYASMHHRKASYDTVNDTVTDSARAEPFAIPERAPTETEIASNIPLPLGDNDVNEIEVPGLARTYEEHESSGMQTPVPRNSRPTSAIMLAPAEAPQRRSTRARPLSMPALAASPFSVPPLFSGKRRVSTEVEPPFETAMEQPNCTSYMGTESHPELPIQAAGDVRQQSGQESPPEADPDMMAFAASTGMGFRMSEAQQPHRLHLSDTTDDEADVADTAVYEGEPKILHSKRMSLEKTGPPGLVRTFSTRSSSLRSAQNTPVATPKLPQQAEGRSYLDDSRSDEEDFEHQAIGVARTSDIPIRSTPTPPVESPFVDKGKHAAHGGYVEVQPRHSGPTSVPFRKTTTPDAKPVVPERSVARKEPHKREVLGGDDHATGTARDANATRDRPAASSQRSRDASLPPLEEVNSYPHTSIPKSPSRSHMSQNGPSKSTGDSIRSQRGAPGGSPSSDKAGVLRMPSTSSKKSGSIHAKPVDWDSGASQRSQVLHGRMSEEDRERQFDSLVNGEETVKFTLTPQTVRDINHIPSPVQKKVETSRPTTATVTVHPRVNADKDNSFGTSNLPNRSAPRSHGPTTTQHRPSPSRKVVTRPLAREPRIEGESMRDFADFIRSTGPSPGQEKAVQPFVNISGNGPKSSNPSSSSLGRRMSTKQQNIPRDTDNPPPKKRMNMEPRSPAGLSNGHDDLIDFIRQGPPSATNGQHRIPRNVAPFRTTVDSDQFDNMLDGHGNVESAYGSTVSTLESKQSSQTINSRTGLLPEPKTVQPAYSNTPQKLSGNMASNSEPAITRTRRRVKDPYAIDVSDEEAEDEDQLTALPHSSQPPASKQESLMDFLNGMEPPTNSKPQPFVLSDETIAAAKARANTSNSTLSSSNTTTRNGHHSPSSQFGAISSTAVASDAPRAYKPRLQARSPAVSDGPRGGKAATSDLADFLRNSGPPEPVMPSPGIARKEEEKRSRKFWKRGKTYGDLP